MNHLTDAQILTLVRAADAAPEWSSHAAGCARCQAELGAWQAFVSAACAADELTTGPVVVPPFEGLVAGLLPAPAPVLAVPVRSRISSLARSLPRRARLALAVVAWQRHLLPRSLAPLTLLGLAVAFAVALSVPSTTWGVRLFGMLVTLSMLAGAAVIMGQTRRDPRRELLYAVPVPPGAVFLARLTLVLALDTAGALGVSVAASAAGHPASLADLILAWLGPSLLSSSVAVLIAVAGPAWLGSTIGAALWLVGSMATLPDTRRDVGLGAVIARLWSTNPATLIAAAVLLAAAVAIASRPMRNPSGGGAAV